MCGIAGFLFDPAARADSAAHLARMTGCIGHRGPDGDGQWLDAEGGVALGHRRLAIVDLSPQGAQPMHSASGRYVVVFNGEIYNHRALRRRLEDEGAAPEWRGHSDTEVMLAAFEHWGLEDTLPRLSGMFAMAVWDRTTRTLTLARDRMGEKPLYYGWLDDRTFAFGSELKALRQHPAWRGEIDRDALAQYLRFGYVPAPRSIHRGIAKLPPAHHLRVRTPATRAGTTAAPAAYWSARAVAERGLADPFRGSDQEAIAELDGLLRDAVALQMEADVPLGAFLSGGVDSSVVVALMQARSAAPVRSFSIGFTEAGYDEAHHARAVAQHLRTDHTELYVTPEEAMAVVPRLPAMYDEPFADSSQIPTFLVASLARRHVAVSLSGDAGDELFGGYNRYFWGPRVWQRLARVPRIGRRAAAGAIRSLSPQAWERLAGPAAGLLPRRLRVQRPGEKLHKLAGVLAASDPAELYGALVTVGDLRLAHGAAGNGRGGEPGHAWLHSAGFAEAMMYQDLVTYLPDDILVKVDRACMAVSLEGRVPLLDPRVVEFAWRLPLHLRIRDGEGKWILRRVLDRYVPRTLIDRPKMGFGVPVGDWLRGPLRDWAEALLDAGTIREQGFLDADVVHEIWRDHLAGGRDHAPQLWVVLMFQAWLAER